MMVGYREDKLDLYVPRPEAEKGVWPWVRLLLLLVCGISYVPILFGLYGLIEFPTSFGIQFPAGESSTLAEFHYSYLLLKRHNVLDVVTFVYMWLPFVSLIAWLAARKLRSAKFSKHTDETEQR